MMPALPANPSQPIPPNATDSVGGFTFAASVPPPAPPDQPPPPSAPSIPGFIDSSFTPIIQPPVNPYYDPQDDTPKQREIPSSAAITNEEVRDALEVFVKKNCCYGPPDLIQIQDIHMKSAFQYRLTTFSEKRETVWQSEPYTNQMVEGPSGHPIPGPWDYSFQPGQSFVGETRKLKIPNTSTVRPCHTCFGGGRSRCTHCNGFGGSNCVWCHGSGTKMGNERCTSCNGMGRSRCTWCHGDGMIVCKTCNGRSQLYMYLELIITWAPHTGEFISDSTAIPKKNLSKAEGIRALSETNRRIYPLTNFPDPEINRASKDLVQQHFQTYSATGLILEQRHEVDIIRIAEVDYSWKGKRGTFHVYGSKNEVYFPKYPQTCYCGCFNCTII